MATLLPSSPLQRAKDTTSGAFGAGLVLVVLPSLALVFGARQFDKHPVVGLPILAIFGIMILFGALALISTLFARLQLEDRAEALALPPGSVRAAIALALIVLFALISVMLYQTLENTYKIEGLSEAEKVALVKEPANRVTAVIPRPCPPGSPPAVAHPAASASASGALSAPATAAIASPVCTAGQFIYTVHLRQAPSSESTDLAKQLLILIGTLMTSVTSFYFASRAAEATTKTAFAAVAGTTDPSSTTHATTGALTKPIGSGADPSGASTPGEDHVDGCDAVIDDPTPDEDLPPARGGVASPGAAGGGTP